MGARRRWFSVHLRHPKTRQELRENQGRNPFARGKRRKKHLPSSWDDLWIRKEKSWKYLGRDHQYRDKDNGYDWHEFPYSWRDAERRMIAHNIEDWLAKLGCFHEQTRDGVRWFGPSKWIRGYCPGCYAKLISDTLSEEFGDWCPNDDCSYFS